MYVVFSITVQCRLPLEAAGIHRLQKQEEKSCNSPHSYYILYITFKLFFILLVRGRKELDSDSH